MLYLGLYYPAKGNGISSLLSIPSFYYLASAQRSGTRLLSSIPKKQISTLYLCHCHLSERTLMLYSGLSYLAKGSGTRLLLSISGKQISMLYTFIIYLRKVDHILNWRLSYFLRLLLSISRKQIPILSSRLYHLSRGSRSNII